eukprot:2769295-Rhodomonas_salina.1
MQWRRLEHATAGSSTSCSKRLPPPVSRAPAPARAPVSFVRQEAHAQRALHGCWGAGGGVRWRGEEEEEEEAQKRKKRKQGEREEEESTASASTSQRQRKEKSRKRKRGGSGRRGHLGVREAEELVDEAGRGLVAD